MSDEFDVVHLGEEDVQQIINWATSTAALAILMQNSPKGSNVGEELERLRAIIEGIDLMVSNIPPVLVQPATVIAVESMDDAVHEQEQVDEFLDEIKDL